MKRVLLQWTALLLCLTFVVLPVGATQLEQQADQTARGLSALGGKPGALLGNSEEFPPGTSVCDWAAMALALSGSREDYRHYLKNLEQYVTQAYEENGGLDRVKSAPYHRIALTVLALGGDPTAFGAQKIDLIADGTYAFQGGSIGDQGLNGWIYALLALDASGAEVPQDARFPREAMVLALVDAQNADGGFGLAVGTASDVDMTAMALQALAPCQNQYPAVIEGALTFLAQQMNSSCRFSSYGQESAESSAQVILALAALGIDPVDDSRFCIGVENLLTGLQAFRQDDGTYGHLRQDTEGNYLATAQCLLALTALERLRENGTWIFDFSVYSGPNQAQANPVPYILMAAALVLTGWLMIRRKRRNHGKNHG